MGENELFPLDPSLEDCGRIMVGGTPPIALKCILNQGHERIYRACVAAAVIMYPDFPPEVNERGRQMIERYNAGG